MSERKPDWQSDDGRARLYCGDSVEISPDVGLVDSTVTDPPYGLSFMGRKWDYDVPAVALWEAVLSAMKPGAHLLSFAGTRTQHRMCVNIEDAGFEIRDMIAWVYGSGFPKSLDVSKAMDKAAGATRKAIGVGPNASRRPASRRVSDGGSQAGGYDLHFGDGDVLTAPATDAAKHWDGWGTALKPALEPITLARKPLVGTVAENVQEYGVGAMNVDGCRVQAEPWTRTGNKTDFRGGRLHTGTSASGSVYNPGEVNGHALGRWPANLIHDGSDEVLAGFPHAPSGGVTHQPRRSGFAGFTAGRDNGTHVHRLPDSGSAARFFYVAKASKADRDEGCEELPPRDGGHYAQDEWSRSHMGATPDAKRQPVHNFHPTVKPTDLMRYLCRLITPPRGIVLDPFMGSGSTGKAAVKEGFGFVGIERDPEYFEIAKARIQKAIAEKVEQLPLAV